MYSLDLPSSTKNKLPAATFLRYNQTIARSTGVSDRCLLDTMADAFMDIHDLYERDVIVRLERENKEAEW